MTVVTKSLTLGNYAFSAVALIIGLVALWQWVQALLALGPASFADAMGWTVLTLIASVPVFVIEAVEKRVID